MGFCVSNTQELLKRCSLRVGSISLWCSLILMPTSERLCRTAVLSVCTISLAFTLSLNVYPLEFIIGSSHKSVYSI